MSSKNFRRPQAPKVKIRKKYTEHDRERPIKNKIKKRDKYRPKELDDQWD